MLTVINVLGSCRDGYVKLTRIWTDRKRCLQISPKYFKRNVDSIQACDVGKEYTLLTSYEVEKTQNQLMASCQEASEAVKIMCKEEMEIQTVKWK